MKIDSHTVYVFNITDRIELGHIKKQVLYDKVTDGRISGLLMEDFIESAFENVAKAPNAKSPFDLYVDDYKYESRVVTGNGVKLIPSNQIGTGRKFNLEGYKAKRAGLDGYVFTEVADSPVLRILMLPEPDVPLVREMKRKDCLNLFSRYPNKKVKL